MKQVHFDNKNLLSNLFEAINLTVMLQLRKCSFARPFDCMNCVCVAVSWGDTKPERNCILLAADV